MKNTGMLRNVLKMSVGGLEFLIPEFTVSLQACSQFMRWFWCSVAEGQGHS